MRQRLYSRQPHNASLRNPGPFPGNHRHGKPSLPRKKTAPGAMTPSIPKPASISALPHSPMPNRAKFCRWSARCARKHLHFRFFVWTGPDVLAKTSGPVQTNFEKSRTFAKRLPRSTRFCVNSATYRRSFGSRRARKYSSRSRPALCMPWSAAIGGPERWSRSLPGALRPALRSRDSRCRAAGSPGPAPAPRPSSRQSAASWSS